MLVDVQHMTWMHIKMPKKPPERNTFGLSRTKFDDFCGHLKYGGRNCETKLLFASLPIYASEYPIQEVLSQIEEHAIKTLTLCTELREKLEEHNG